VDDGWTLEELAARVKAALDGPAYAGAPNGRVRDVPDARAIRWYATIGLVDRPATMRGRTAIYGPRHLLQLIAVKRRQAQGRRLADIQAELAGASDATLRAIAGIDVAVPVADAPARPRFWAERPTDDAPVKPAPKSAVVPLSGLQLAGGAVLLLPSPPDPDDVAAITAAVEPLIDVLSARGLLHPIEAEGAAT
jgi:DNA-binding transcriptional MerR regulator